MAVIEQVFLIFAAGVSASYVLGRVGMPAIVGELVAGALLGPHVLGWIHLNQSTSTLAAVGVVILLFTAGLEMRVPEVAEVGAAAFSASVAGVAVTVAAAYALLSGFGYATGAALLAAIALAATSAGVGTRVLGDLGLLRGRAGRVTMGAAVIDDVLVLVALAIALAADTDRSGLSVVVTVISAIGFIVLVVAAGPRLARRHGRLLASPTSRRSPVVPALVLCLGLAALAERAGLAALVGAFLAGMVLAETREQVPLEEGMRPLAEFLVPFFFVTAGARVDLHTLFGAGLPLAIALSTVAVATKLAACAAGAIGLRRGERALVGAAMIARGEVTLASASAALAAGRFPQKLFSAVLAAVFVSAFAGPLAVRALARHGMPTGDAAGTGESLEDAP